MATGPEHYREAERQIEEAWSGDQSHPEWILLEAQVHATLALAAATALANYCGDRMTEGDSRRWFETASAHPEHLRLQRERDRAELAEFAEEQQS